jgi:hypothetical protein
MDDSFDSTGGSFPSVTSLDSVDGHRNKLQDPRTNERR